MNAPAADRLQGHRAVFVVDGITSTPGEERLVEKLTALAVSHGALEAVRRPCAGRCEWLIDGSTTPLLLALEGLARTSGPSWWQLSHRSGWDSMNAPACVAREASPVGVTSESGSR